MFILLTANQVSQLGQDFTNENILLVQSPKITLTDTQAWTDFNLLSASENVLLLISIRPKDNTIVFNSRTAGGPWGPEERVPLAGQLEGNTPSIAIYDHGDRYQILLNLKTVLYYNKRLLESGVAFGYDQDETSDVAFGNTLALDVYDSLADIIPRLSGSN
ncbi:hypothetical protein FA15DRAFT_666281 [Coprinopsis marcescibilis]|uniref:Galectin n=1 Tax=Coprinopsis marcescibilis TaxID=230819 RepID=A0A5C3L3N0_COPMA|nr:hypothetical protein FA15DRAFT_666281 [Coprinopsis marcescibilis]